MPSQVPSDEFQKFLVDLLRDGDIPADVRALAEEVQMRLATPGDFEAAKFQPPDLPESENGGPSS